MSKHDTIVKMIRRKRGATLTELARATGWKAHSVTGTLSRLRGSGLPVAKQAEERRGTVYRVAA